MDDVIKWDTIRQADIWLDSTVSPIYQEQPLAQDWARVAKMTEEIGEAIAELIGFTGQNPRKPKTNNGEPDAMLLEIADAVITGILGIQHFTKDEWTTQMILRSAISKLESRIPIVFKNRGLE